MDTTKKIKVIEFVGQLADGGAETLVVNYAKLLNPQIFEVSVLTIYPNCNTANAKRLEKASIPVISVFKKHNIISKCVWHICGKKYMDYRLRHIIKSYQPDVIHIHLENLKYLVPISDDLHGIKLFFTCHSLPTQMLSGKNVDEGKAAKYLIDNAGMRMIALHEDMRKEINNMFDIQNTTIIRNGVDKRAFVALKETCQEIRKSLGINPDCYLVGHVGRFTDVKNHAFLLDVFKCIVEEKDNSHLLLVGTGETEQSIRQKVKNLGLEQNVSIYSHRTDIPRLLKALDVFVFPSLYEGLSVTLVEAQTAGVRCVISENINIENVLSSNTIQLSLDKPAAEWARVALDETIKTEVYGNIENYDMNREIINLEKLYLE